MDSLNRIPGSNYEPTQLDLNKESDFATFKLTRRRAHELNTWIEVYLGEMYVNDENEFDPMNILNKTLSHAKSPLEEVYITFKITSVTSFMLMFGAENHPEAKEGLNKIVQKTINCAELVESELGNVYKESNDEKANYKKVYDFLLERVLPEDDLDKVEKKEDKIPNHLKSV